MTGCLPPKFDIRDYSFKKKTAFTTNFPSKFSCKGRGIGIARCENRGEMQLRGVCNACLIGTISAPWADEITA